MFLKEIVVECFHLAEIVCRVRVTHSGDGWSGKKCGSPWPGHERIVSRFTLNGVLCAISLERLKVWLLAAILKNTLTQVAKGGLAAGQQNQCHWSNAQFSTPFQRPFTVSLFLNEHVFVETQIYVF